MDLSNLSIEELETILAARRIMDRAQGTQVPEPQRRKRASEPTPTEDKPKDWKKTIKNCPKCGTTGPVEPTFGTITQRGVVYPQSWCKDCRAKTSAQYRKTEKRTYRTKHSR